MSLTSYLIEGLLPEEEKKRVVAVYGGGFKPPTSGHFEVVKQALKENPEIAIELEEKIKGNSLLVEEILMNPEQASPEEEK